MNSREQEEEVSEGEREDEEERGWLCWEQKRSKGEEQRAGRRVAGGQEVKG